MKMFKITYFQYYTIKNVKMKINIFKIKGTVNVILV